MNRLFSFVLCLAVLSATACAKKESKPLRTEPWLAHPSASTAAGDTALPVARYSIAEPSQIRFELPTKRGAVRGTLTRISGELRLAVQDLAHSRGELRVDLDSLSFDTSDNASDQSSLARARSALELPASGANSAASFELTALEDLSTPELEPAPASDTLAPFVRRARATVVGNLLLHGFRVTRRAPLEAEFGFGDDRQLPNTVLIRSRSPFVISLETHAIRAPDAERNPKPHSSATPRTPEILVTIDLHCIKSK